MDVEAAAANELIEERRASSRAEVLLRVEMAQAWKRIVCAYQRRDNVLPNSSDGNFRNHCRMH